ncbi:MAG TPA: NUDIX domain-containing protein [Actinomycetales bacterium]|nr:NUDIX domain-containing protein [Actinomycetales bacterium]
MSARLTNSAGLLVYRGTDRGVEVLLGHMGGPFWARKDAGAWSIPKGEYTSEEEPFQAACREFTEELGLPAPNGTAIDLGQVRQSGGKTVRAWAVEGQVDPAAVKPGTFSLEWPPRSGRKQEFPEVDRVAWFAPDEARAKLVRAQTAFVDRLVAALESGATADG